MFLKKDRNLKKQVLKKSNLRAVWDWLSILFTNIRRQIWPIFEPSPLKNADVFNGWSLKGCGLTNEPPVIPSESPNNSEDDQDIANQWSFWRKIRYFQEFCLQLIGAYTQYVPITNVGIFPPLGVLYFCPDFQCWRS